MNKFRAFIGIFFLAVSIGRCEEVIRIGIGTQDTTINCAAGGAVVRELHLLEKYLPHDGRYKDIKYEIVWHNFTSGAPANTEMLANKLDITNMADFPAILGASAFQAANNGVKTYYIATLSGSTRGAGNAVVVPLQSKVQSFSELKGKRIPSRLDQLHTQCCCGRSRIKAGIRNVTSRSLRRHRKWPGQP